jgi:hypothetical protein
VTPGRWHTVRRGRALLLVALASAGLAGPSAASLPPTPTTEDLVTAFWKHTREHAAGCSAQAEREGRFGDVMVRFVGRRRFTLRPSRSLGNRYDACLRRALREQLERESFPGPTAQESRPDPFYPGAENPTDLWLGTPAPLLPAPAAILPAWRALVQAPPAARATAAAALSKVLPPDVRVDAAACLAPVGGAIRRGLELWVERWGRPLRHEWMSLFAPAWAGHVVDDAIVTTLSQVWCLVPLDQAGRRALLEKTDAAGACWSGDLVQRLLSRRVSFPADRRYRWVGLAAGRGCAIDQAGAIVCCGEPRGAPPAGAFTRVSVGPRHACALAADGHVACWGEDRAGETSAPAGAFTEISVAPALSCALAKSGAVVCWGRALAQAIGGPFNRERFVHVSAGEEGACAVRADGGLLCATADALREQAGPFQAADSGRPCALRADGTVWCSAWKDFAAWGLAARGRFTSIAVARAFGCGRQTDGTLDCFGQVPRGSPPAGTFTQLAAGPAVLCGVRNDGTIACWGADEGSFSFAPPAP